MRVLLTGARAPATLETARLVARASHDVRVADTDRWHVCRGSAFIARSHVLPAPRAERAAHTRAIRGLVERRGIDVVIPTCEEAFHLAAIRDHVSARVTSEPLARLRPLHDKAQFVAACAEAAVQAPRTYPLETSTSLHVLPEDTYILKPRFSRFATRVRQWTTGDGLPAIDGRGWIAQRFVPGARPAGTLLEPPAELHVRSRRALAIYHHPHRPGAGPLDADDDPWPRRLQCVTWVQLLLRSLIGRTAPRLLSTRDIEWNGA